MPMSKSEIRTARKAARAAGLPLTGELALASDAKAAANRPAYPKPRRRPRRHPEDAIYLWARRYDALNGAPENDDDR